jgi:hypothetical protein
MTDLVACVSIGEGTWGHVARLIEGQEWSNIFLISNQFGKENFKVEKPVKFILIDSKKTLPELIQDIKKELEGKINDIEVAVNLISGTGKEHMAILSALLKLGLGVRLIALTKEGIKEV